MNADASVAQAGDHLEKLARVGYATKGLLYCILGALAVQAAFFGGSTTGSKGAVQTIGQQPFGVFLLVLTAIGLSGYAGWRFVQAVLDPEHEGNDKKAIAKRVGYGVSGAIHVALAVAAVQMVLGSSSGGSKRTYLGAIMTHPAGQVLVGLGGAAVVLAGVAQLIQAKTAKFRRQLDTGTMSGRAQQLALWSGRSGLAARGGVFAIMGGYAIEAAITSDPNDIKGIGGALSQIGSSGLGTTMLAIVAAGLFAYGVYQFVLARYRRMPS